MDERQPTLARMDEAWDVLRERVRGWVDEERRSGAPERPITLAQAIGHLADWDAREAAYAEIVASGVALEARTDEEGILNARWLARDVYLPLDDAEKRLDANHARRRAVLVGLDEAGWQRVGRASAQGATAHYRSHTEDPFGFPVDRDECMRILGAAWIGMRECLGRLARGEEPPAGDAVQAPIGAVIAHVARWDDASADVFRARRTDPRAVDPYAPDYREWNARWLTEDAEVTAEEALARLDAAAVRFRSTLETLDHEAWRRWGLPYAIGTAEHYRSHTEWPLLIPLPGDGTTD